MNSIAAAVGADGPAPLSSPGEAESRRARFISVVWFAGIHVACLLVLLTGVSTVAVVACLIGYAVRMFAISAGYHRYFSHRTYSTSRPMRFFFGVLGTLAIQKGPLWWASVHRHHHRVSDQPEDAHSPLRHGFWWSHVGWICGKGFTDTDLSEVRDLAAAPELRLLDRFHWVPPVIASFLVYLLGEHWAATRPEWHTNGFQLLLWTFGIGTVLLYHGTWSVNSLVHMFGKRRFRTTDDSRNNWLVALWTFGEGWHNNHHRFSASERQGFYWWEYDPSHWILSVLRSVRLIWNVKRPPQSVLDEGRA